MNDEPDASNGSESLSIEQAAAAYTKATTPEPVVKDQGEDAAADESDDTTDDELQASEDASDEDDGETEDPDQAEDDGEETDPESDHGRFVADNAKVRLPDGSVTTIADLKSGSLRNADYTQKTQALAEQRKTFESQSERLKASEQQLEQQREYVAQLVQSIIPAQPDPSMLESDPMGYMSQKAQAEQWAQHLAYLDAEQQRSTQERQAETARQTGERLNKEWATALEKLPELKDAKRLDAFGKDAIKFGTSAYGYSQDELATMHHDHRQLLVLKDAIAWRKLQASKTTVAKKVEGRPPVQKGGKRLNPSEARARSANDAFNRLKSSGSEADAAAAWIANLNKG